MLTAACPRNRHRAVGTHTARPPNLYLRDGQRLAASAVLANDLANRGARHRIIAYGPELPLAAGRAAWPSHACCLEPQNRNSPAWLRHLARPSVFRCAMRIALRVRCEGRTLSPTASPASAICRDVPLRNERMCHAEPIRGLKRWAGMRACCCTCRPTVRRAASSAGRPRDAGSEGAKAAACTMSMLVASVPNAPRDCLAGVRLETMRFFPKQPPDLGPAALIETVCGLQACVLSPRVSGTPIFSFYSKRGVITVCEQDRLTPPFENFAPSSATHATMIGAVLHGVILLCFLPHDMISAFVAPQGCFHDAMRALRLPSTLKHEFSGSDCSYRNLALAHVWAGLTGYSRPSTHSS